MTGSENPTHVVFGSDGRPEQFVFGAEGYEPELVAVLPEGFWDAPRRWAEGHWEEDWQPLHDRLHAQVDASAGAVRCRFITVSPGQEMTYLRKDAEAKAWAPDADPASFPMMAAEAEAMGIDMAAVAARVLAASARWERIGSAIEGVRMRAKRAVLEAPDMPSKLAAAEIDWEAVLAAAEGSGS
jgi:hypothetical protein